MESALEIGRNALLFTLVVLLIVILYKRALVFMNKRSETGAYFDITDFKPSIVVDSRLELTFPESTNLKLEVQANETNKVVFNAEKEFQTGDDTWEFSLKGMTAGKYTLVVSSDNAKVTRFFNLWFTCVLACEYQEVPFPF